MGLIVLLVLLRAGLLLHTAGSVRARSAASTVGRGLLESAVAALLVYGVGYLAFLGVKDFEIEMRLIPLVATAWFATSVVTGTMAERSRLSAQLAVAGAVGVVVPLAYRWLDDLSAVTGVSLGCAIAGAIAAVVLGARQGKYNRDGSANILPGHNLTLQLHGIVLLALTLPVLFAGVGEKPIAGAILASSAAMLVAAGVTTLRFGKVDVLLCSAGGLAGAVAGAVAGGVFGSPLAIIVGAVVGFVAQWLTVQIDLRYRVDDPGGYVAPIVTACVAVALVVVLSPLKGGAAWADAAKFGGLTIACAGLVAIIVAGVVLGMNAIKRLREHEDDEYEGLDLTRHDINAYPDFQQTMIKSYHLRQ
jgi:Amt family ammonium transporter